MTQNKTMLKYCYQCLFFAKLNLYDSEEQGLKVVHRL